MNVRPGSIFLTVLGTLLVLFIVLAATAEPKSDQEYKESIVVVLNTGENKCFNGATTTTWDSFVRVSHIPGDSVQSRTFPERRVHEVIDKNQPCP